MQQKVSCKKQKNRNQNGKKGKHLSQEQNPVSECQLIGEETSSLNHSRLCSSPKLRLDLNMSVEIIFVYLMHFNVLKIQFNSSWSGGFYLDSNVKFVQNFKQTMLEKLGVEFKTRLIKNFDQKR